MPFLKKLNWKCLRSGERAVAGEGGCAGHVWVWRWSVCGLEPTCFCWVWTPADLLEVLIFKLLSTSSSIRNKYNLVATNEMVFITPHKFLVPEISGLTWILRESLLYRSCTKTWCNRLGVTFYKYLCFSYSTLKGKALSTDSISSVAPTQSKLKSRSSSSSSTSHFPPCLLLITNSW